MEDALMNNREIKGFIDPNGILIRIANINLGEDPVEIMAESILRNMEKCTTLGQEMKQALKQMEPNKLYRNYLIKTYFYIYIHLQYKDECVEIKELKSSNDVTECQRKRIKTLCKDGIKSIDLPKILEKK